MENRLLIPIIVGTAVIAATGLATAYGLIPVNVLALVLIANTVVIFCILKRRTSLQVQRWKPTKRVLMIWPLSLIVCGTLAALDAMKNGWKRSDSVGAIVGVVILVAWLLVYRKQHRRGSDL
jgi:hypothetical protein